MRTYQKTHSWLTFQIDLTKASPRLWMALGEAQSKCEHVAGIPLTPETARDLHRVYLAKGILATTAIEGNTLSEEEVRKHLDGQLQLPPSREYQKKEIENILNAFNSMVLDIHIGNFKPISPSIIKNFNSLILQGLEPGENVIPGEIRKDSRVVGRYLCAPAEDCAYLLNQFCSWMNGDTFSSKDGDSIVHGIIKAMVAHIYFVWIHPFADGNGRTARLLELKFLMEAGVPSDAAHLLSNYYNLTRPEYYIKLDGASKSGDDLLPFIDYGVRGFVEQLREQIAVIREQQINVAWVNHIHKQFKTDKSSSSRRQRRLVLAISESNRVINRVDAFLLTPELAAEYVGKTAKTVSRDLNALIEKKLIKRVRGGYIAAKEEVRAFLPVRRQATGDDAATTAEIEISEENDDDLEDEWIELDLEEIDAEVEEVEEADYEDEFDFEEAEEPRLL
jgi:Fic family protein